MCYYNGVRVSLSEFIKLKNEEKELNIYKEMLWRPLQSGFDYGEWPIVKPSADYSNWDIINAEWGFIPTYLHTREQVNKFRNGYKDEKGKFHPPITTLNAKGEELLNSNKIYRDAALKRRCLIFSSGFYEWRHIYPIGKKGIPLKTAVKYPYYITLPEKEYFFVAGIWQPWVDKSTGESIDTFSLITTASNSLMSSVHNSKMRQPCILTNDLAEEWISNDLTEERIMKIASHQFESKKMKAYSIDKNFKTAKEPTLAVEYEELTPLEL